MKYHPEFRAVEYLCISEDFHELSSVIKVPFYVYEFHHSESALFLGELHGSDKNKTLPSHCLSLDHTKVPTPSLKLNKTDKLELDLHNAKIALWENKLKRAVGEIAIAGIKHRISQERLKRGKLEAKGGIK